MDTPSRYWLNNLFSRCNA
ncbi:MULTISPECIES: YsgD/CorL family protein [Winslowiella]